VFSNYRAGSPASNPSGDFHAYSLSLIAKEKAALKQQKNKTQQAGVASQAPVAAVVSDISFCSNQRDSPCPVESRGNQQREEFPREQPGQFH